MSDELKPCPFCGGQAEYAFRGNHWGITWKGYITVMCKTCRASANGAFYHGEPIEDIPLGDTKGGAQAEYEWNRRA